MVNKCCCFSLRTGVLIFASLNVLLSVCLIIANNFTIAQHSIFYLLSMFVAVVAFYGIFKEKPNFIWPFMLVQAIQIVFLIWIHIRMFYQRRRDTFTESEVTFLVIIAVNMYLLFITFTYYRRKKRETNSVLVCVTSVYYVEPVNTSDNGISSEKERVSQNRNYAENDFSKVNFV